MEKTEHVSRRMALKSSVFGLLIASIPNVLFAKTSLANDDNQKIPPGNVDRYPAVDESIVAEVVGVSHFNFERLQTLVNTRPELARATWDWGFGDWETAVGAASHVGRRDIALYLLSKGARPDIFTYAMLGSFQAVKLMVESVPGIQTIMGPHGISLLQHAKTGLDDAANPNKSESAKLVDYLESLGDAGGNKYATIDDKDKAKYLGDYKYGDGEKEGFTIKLNMKKNISFGKLGKSGGALYKVSDDQFIYNGTTSVKISFALENDKVVSLTVSEPGLVLRANKVL